MNEAEGGAALPLAQQAVLVRQPAAELVDLLDEALALLVVVVQVHLHVARAQAHHLRNALEQVAPVLFLGVKEAVLGVLAAGVPWAVARNARPTVAPPGDAAQRGFNRGAHAQRLIVIGNENPGALWPGGAQGLAQAVP